MWGGSCLKIVRVLGSGLLIDQSLGQIDLTLERLVHS
jgi:hypothetical protein